ncbi:hypothetical protein PMAYCL1PPCAC_01475, partial [Pristionchus mayeri]
KRVTCIVCGQSRHYREMREFTKDSDRRKKWVEAVRSTIEGRESLMALLNSRGKSTLCSNHFATSDFTQFGSQIRLNNDAVPSFKEGETVDGGKWNPAEITRKKKVAVTVAKKEELNKGTQGARRGSRGSKKSMKREEWEVDEEMDEDEKKEGEPKWAGRLRTRAQPTAPPQMTEADYVSPLMATVVKVCKDEGKLNKAIDKIGKTTEDMNVDEITTECFKAFKKLSVPNTWDMVKASMTEENPDMPEIMPQEEKNLFNLLIAMKDSKPEELAYILDRFIADWCVKDWIDPANNGEKSNAEVARNVRCLFSALALTQRGEQEKVKKARWHFHRILTKVSSQAVCQSLVYLLCNSRTTSLASEILKIELNDDEFGGRLISIHMNHEDADVLKWAINRFADPSCKNLPTAAFRTPATLEMVEEWWKSDMEILEKARDQPDFTYLFGRDMPFDDFYTPVHNRMFQFMSVKTAIEGLDRVKMLSEMDTSAIDAVDLGTSAESNSLSDIDGRVVILKIHLSYRILQSLQTRMVYMHQREALRIHLITSIEKVNSIFARPICKDDLWRGWALPGSNFLTYSILIMKQYLRRAEAVMGTIKAINDRELKGEKMEE